MQETVETKSPFGDIRPKRKSPTIAAILGILFVGLGHAYLGMWGKAIGLFVLAIIASLLTAGILAPVFWIVSCVWAYSDAKKLNLANGYTD